MALPATGVTWKEAHGDSFNPLGLFKGTITNWIVRTYLGSLTSLSDPATGTITGDDGGDYFSPFAEDGTWRDDLLDPDFPGGAWRDPGSISDDAFKLASQFDTERVFIGQMIRPARYDETTQEDTFEVTCEEFVNPVVLALKANKSLVSLPDVGARRAFTMPAEPTRIEYQAALLAEDGDKRLAIVLPRITRTNVGDTNIRRGGDRAVGVPLTYGTMLCPFTGVPFYIVPEGSGYRGLGGAPVFSTAPAATPGGVGAASVVFTIPTLPRDPAPDTFTYTWETKTDAGAWIAKTAATTTSTSVSVTSTFTGLTPGSTQFRVTATAASGMSTVSLPSTAVTIT